MTNTGSVLRRGCAAAALLAAAFTGAAAPADGVAGHVAKAKAAAGSDFAAAFAQCDSAVEPAKERPRGAPPPPPGAPLEPARVFDNLYFVGLRSVSAWAVKTSDGIILIDALNNARDAETTIAAGLRKVGLDPAQIRYLVITHAHGDHYGGAQWLVERYRPRVVMSAADWKVLEGPPSTNPNWGPPPKRDMTAADGQKLTLGDTTIELRITPGHTPGTLSVLIPVKDRGAPHVAALWGGTAFNFAPSPERFQLYADSTVRFAAQARGADVLLSNHPVLDGTIPKLTALKARKPGQPNPYVVGSPAVGRFLTTLGECALANKAALDPVRPT